MSFLKGTI